MVTANTVNEVRPQRGPQEKFLASSADIVIYGGAAGGGKSFALLMEPLRHVQTNPQFYAVIFRRNTVQVRNPGGLWDESMGLYGLTDASPSESVLEWQWPEGGKVKFAHLEHEKTKLDWQGAQVPLICWDELTHFTKTQFFYLLSRNRSMCGVRPYIRATCNPDADSWVAEFIAWWIDNQTGFPIPERMGVVRWFIVLGDKTLWGDTRQELIDKYGTETRPKSATFIPASVYDNKILMQKDPGYLANLMALPVVEKARLLNGNWKIRPAAGLYFRREWCGMVDALPVDLEMVRYWDLAATEKTEGNDPDWTVGWKMGRERKTGIFYVAHVSRFRKTPFETEKAWKNIASQDSGSVRIGFPQDPGQAGKTQAQYIVRELMGYTVGTRAERGDKIVRFGPFSSQCQAGNVKFLRASWNDEVFTALEAFPESAHDDEVDAAGGAFGMFLGNTFGWIDHAVQQTAEKEKKAREVQTTA